jgi:hypothetical protein
MPPQYDPDEPLFATYYRAAMKRVYGVHMVRVKEKYYPKFEQRALELMQRGIDLQEYSTTVAKSWVWLVTKRELSMLPVPIFLGPKSAEKFAQAADRFTVIPNAVINMVPEQISPSAATLYMVLGQQRKCDVSYRVLQAKTGWGSEKLTKCLSQLVDSELLSMEKRFSQCAIYTLHIGGARTFTLMPNSVIDLMPKRLSPSAAFLYLLLKQYERGKGVSWPAYSTLCSRTGWSLHTVSKHLKQLVDAGLVTKKGRIADSNKYYTHEPDESVD